MIKRQFRCIKGLEGVFKLYDVYPCKDGILQGDDGADYHFTEPQLLSVLAELPPEHNESFSGNVLAEDIKNAIDFSDMPPSEIEMIEKCISFYNSIYAEDLTLEKFFNLMTMFSIASASQGTVDMIDWSTTGLFACLAGQAASKERL